MRELVEGEAHVTFCPLVVHQEHVVEAKTLLVHVQEPHGHATRPDHKTDELDTLFGVSKFESGCGVSSSRTRYTWMKKRQSAKRSVCALRGLRCIRSESGIYQPGVRSIYGGRRTGFGLLVHQRYGHDDVVEDAEADLEVRAEGKLHSEEDVRENGREFGVGASLRVRRELKPR